MTASDADRRAVLVVDDNDVNRMLVRRQLERLDARATCVEDAGDALTAFGTQEFDLVLLDCRLPGVDGFEVAARLRRAEAASGSDRRTPVVALTAVTDPQVRARALAAGMDDLLHKPASIGDLRGMLLRWCPASPPQNAYPVDLATIERLHEEIESPGAVRALLETYLSQLPLRTAGLRAAIRRNDPSAVAALAQELRASGESLGVVRLGLLCQELERAAEHGELHPEQDAARVEELSGSTGTALRSFLAGPARSPSTP